MIKEYKKKDGSKAYMFVAYLGVDPITGKQRRTTRRGFKTQREAKLAEAKLQAEIEASGFTRQTELTFKEVYELWLETYTRTVKPSTLHSQKLVVQNHILPYFGHLYVDKIKMLMCQRFVNKQAETLIRYNNSVNLVYRILEYAKHLGLIKVNPMSNTLRPKKKEGKDGDTAFWNKEQMLQFINALDQSDLDSTAKCTLHLLAFTGMRKGELLALRWQDIDLDKGMISIERTMAYTANGLAFQATKTKAGTRKISIDSASISRLKQHYIEQRRLYFMNGKKTTDETLVISCPEKERYYLDYPNHVLNRLIREYNLTPIPVHGLRHSHCSLLFEAGATIKEVQDRLGHKNIKTTMDIYAHVTDKAKEETADKFATYLTT